MSSDKFVAEPVTIITHGGREDKMLPNEKRIMQEDCSEEGTGPGVLTLTNMRIAFDKTEGRIADFSKRFVDSIFEARLDRVAEVSRQGRFIKTLGIKIRTDSGEKAFKFGVFNIGKWEKAIRKAMADYKDQ